MPDYNPKMVPIGPGGDKYGARILMTVVLCLASIPTAMTGLVQTAGVLAILRLFIGIAGGTFVICQLALALLSPSASPR
jgi:NNP family nitrate/nitrite transporter-like MFS transporter